MRSRQLHNALEHLTKAIREVEAVRASRANASPARIGYALAVANFVFHLNFRKTLLNGCRALAHRDSVRMTTITTVASKAFQR